MKNKLVKILLIEFFVVVIIFLYFFFNNNLHSTIVQNPLISDSQEKPEEFDVNKSKLYLELEKGLLEGKEEIELISISLLKNPSEIFNILESISNENPEVMYYKGAEYRFGKLTLYYSKEKEEIKKHQEEIRQVREKIISKYISPQMTDYDKVLFAHDYIINNSKYDSRHIPEGILPPESYSAYGILSLGIGVCEGYAKAMKYLLDDMGIESTIVVGKSKEENHAWNLVKLEDEYYHVDPTWDDPITNDGSNILRYNFFCLDDAEISKTHSWNRENYPSANSKKYNYFNYNNLIVYGKEELEDRVKNTLLNRKTKLLIKVVSNDNEVIFLDEMIEKLAYDYYELMKLRSYSYSLDEDHGTIIFEFYYK